MAWYCGFVAWRGRQLYGDRPRFLAQLEVTLADGKSVVVATDETWRTVPGPIRESDLLMGEIYDARLELGAWSEPGYQEDHWHSVMVDPPRETLSIEERLGPPVRRTQELKPKVFSKVRRQVIYDCGQNFSGRARIVLNAPRGTEVKLRYAEILQPDGQLYTENLRSAKATDFYICRGGGVEEWEPRFTFHGFRYIEVAGLEKEEWIVDVTGVVIHSDTRPTGRFQCSNELLNQLQRNITWGQRSNFLEVPTDCPQRDERLGWTGDAQVFVRTAAFNMDVRTFFHKWMRDARDVQGKTGSVPAVIPDREFVATIIQGATDGGPAWADAMIICPWTIYLCYGDRQILEEHYDAMDRFMDFLAKIGSKDNIRANWESCEWCGFGDWLALDGSGKLEGATPKDLIGTAYYAYDAAIMADVAELLGRKEDAVRYSQLRKDIGEAFRRRFITPDGLVASGTQTSMVLALHFGLVEGEAKKRMAREFAHDVEQRGYHLATGFVGTSYVPQVLEDNGYLDVAYKLLEQETFPSWLYPLHHGATTIWERWNGWTEKEGPADKSMNSYNHYAYGAIGAWMYSTVAGLELDPAQPGYKHIIFRPRPGGTITWAEASLDTAHGTAAIRWDREGDALRLDLTVPNGTEATLQPPPGFGADRKLGPGRHAVVLEPGA